VWDVVESDLFNAAFDEALGKVLERVLMHLRLTMFGPNNAQAKLPALATLLPQVLGSCCTPTSASSMK
jgi:hypothetical protein